MPRQAGEYFFREVGLASRKILVLGLDRGAQLRLLGDKVEARFRAFWRCGRCEVGAAAGHPSFDTNRTEVAQELVGFTRTSETHGLRP